MGVIPDHPTEGESCSGCTPLPPPECSQCTPPIKRLRPLTEDLRNQNLSQQRQAALTPTTKTQPVESAKRGRTGASKATFQDVKRLDLEDLDRLGQLQRGAVKLGYSNRSESAKLFFIAAAIRAVEVESKQGGHAEKVFCGLIRKNQTGFISQAQEDQARDWIRREHGNIAVFGDVGHQTSQPKQPNLAERIARRFTIIRERTPILPPRQPARRPINEFFDKHSPFVTQSINNKFIMNNFMLHINGCTK